MTVVDGSGVRVADLLRRHRLSAGFTQEELAGRAGVAVRTVRNLELGRVRRPRRHTLEQLADQLRLSAVERSRLLDARPPGAGADPHRPSDRPSTVSLPAALTDFTGRKEPLRRIAALAAGAGMRTVVIAGPPGVGKTSLAVQAAHELAGAFPAGVFFVSLRGTDDVPASPADALGQVLAALGVAHLPQTADDRTAAYRTATSRGGGLLVLDDARDEARVRPLLPAGPGWLTLVTSRGPLPGMSAERIVLDALGEPESHLLLSRAVGADRIATEPAAAAELSRLCGGLPLALRVTANRLIIRPEWSVHSLVDRLRDERHRLDLLHVGDLGVRSAFELSYRRLDAPARRTLRLLSVAPLPAWSGPLVAALTGTDELTAECTVDRLVDVGLVNAAQSRDRVSLHDLMALFAAGRSAAEDNPGERLAAQDRLCEHLLRRCSEAGVWGDPDRPVPAGAVGAPAGSNGASTAEAGSFAGSSGAPTGRAGGFAGRAQAIAWLDQEKAGLWWAIRHAAARGRYGAVLSAARDLFWYCDHRHAALPWTELFHLAVHAARALGDVRQEARQENNLGWALRVVQHRPEQAYPHHVTALRLAREAADRSGEGRALSYLGAVLATRGDTGGAMARLDEAWQIFAELGDRPAGAMVARARAEMLRLLGDAAAARDVIEAALGGAGDHLPAPGGAAADHRPAAGGIGGDHLPAADGIAGDEATAVPGVPQKLGFVVLGQLRIELGLAQAALAEPASAVATLTAALADFAAGDHAGGSGAAHLALANLASAAGKHRTTAYHLIRAAAFFTDAQNRGGLAEVHRVRRASVAHRDTG